MRRIYPYKKNLKETARHLRNNPTPTEFLLWQRLKGNQVRGYDFHRQKPILNYVVDFFCHELELVIELDGSSHDVFDTPEYDAIRQREIEELGVQFLRFRNEEIK